MKMGDLAAPLGGLAGLALAAMLMATPVSAQATDECRCVDRDGQAVERCSCFRAPNFRAVIPSFGNADSRPRLGISVDSDQSRRRDAEGALVTDVLDGGPADEAGIRRGDMITAVDGRSLFEPLAAEVEEDLDLDRSVPVQRLLAIARELEPGQEVEVRFDRDGAERSVTLEAEDLSDSWGTDFELFAPRADQGRLRGQLREMEESMRELRGNARVWRDSEAPRAFSFRSDGNDVRVLGGGNGVIIDRLLGTAHGMELVALNPELGSYFGAEEGVLVTDVEEDSELGLIPGDVVVRIGDREVTSPDRMRRILRSYGPDEDVTFHVLRDGREETVVGRLGG